MKIRFIVIPMFLMSMFPVGLISAIAHHMFADIIFLQIAIASVVMFIIVLIYAYLTAPAMEREML